MPSRKKVFSAAQILSSREWLLFQQCHTFCVVAGRIWRWRLARVKCGLAGCLLAMSVSWIPSLVHSVLGLGPFIVFFFHPGCGPLSSSSALIA